MFIQREVREVTLVAYPEDVSIEVTPDMGQEGPRLLFDHLSDSAYVTVLLLENSQNLGVGQRFATTDSVPIEQFPDEDVKWHLGIFSLGGLSTTTTAFVLFWRRNLELDASDFGESWHDGYLMAQ